MNRRERNPPLRIGDDPMATLLRILAFEAIMAATLFASAGRWDLPWFWAVLAVHTALLTLAMSSIDPDLRRERLKPGPGGKDRYLRLIALPFILAHLIVAGLDVGRFHWSRPMPVGVQALALIGYTAGMALSVCAMTNNRFFSPVVRIQHERGHMLVTSGPYRFVRHPGYLGAILASICGGVALGSWWSLVPLVPFGVLFLRRTAMEDRMLRADLGGYAGYAKRVRYRLVPGLW
jgi:protein-S-isoprenylcysteine O-methyltransferase Ste14